MIEKYGERLDCRDSLSVRKLFFGIIDVLMIEAICNFLVQDAVENVQVQHHGRIAIQGARYGNSALVIVSVSGSVRAPAKGLTVALLAPLRAEVAV